jgi:hypothetical protein
MPKYAQGRFVVKNKDKYLGNREPIYRSSWEFTFMKFCDEHPSIVKWISEGIKIPYRNPFTGKYTVYVPDFLISYVDANGKQKTELIEVKPAAQRSLQEAKKNKRNAAHAILNAAKWEAAQAYCRQNNITFRVVTENDIFHNGKG